jgi:hypothetical protein
MEKAPNQHSVRPTDLHYKGRRIFIPAHSLGDRPDIVQALGPGEAYLGHLASKRALNCIPDDEVISMLCRDLAGELVIDDNAELSFADPQIEFTELDSDQWQDMNYKADDPTTMDSGSIIFKASQLGFLRMACHVSHPFWFPEAGDMVNNSLRVKAALYCNRTPGVQNFVPVIPYTALFSIPKLWVAKKERVLAELKERLLTLYREGFEINLSNERRIKEAKK